MKKLKVGIVGSGFGERVTLPCFYAAKGVEVIAFASRAPGKVRKSARAYGVTQVLSSYEKMLEIKELDLVCIETPPFLHCEMVKKALSAGKHVLCEKPMALNAPEAAEMAKMAKESNCIALIDHQMRFHPNIRKIKAMIDEGELGEIRQVDLTYLTAARMEKDIPWDWWSDLTVGGGQVGAICSHFVDMLRWWFGEIVSVRGNVRTLTPQRFDPVAGVMKKVSSPEYAAFDAALENGLVLRAVTSSVAPEATGTQAQIVGEKATLMLKGVEQLLLQRGNEIEDISAKDELLGKPVIGENPWRTSLVRFAEDIAGSISHNRPGSGATFEDGLRIQEVLDAILVSQEEQRDVRIGEVGRPRAPHPNKRDG